MKKGNVPWNKGMKGTYKFGPPTEETRRKISRANKGKRRSEEARKKISESHKGRTPWNKGKKGIQEAWNKGLKGFRAGRITPEETRKKLSESNKGKKRSDEAKERMRLAKARYYANGGVHPRQGKPMSEEQKKKISQMLKGRPISEEARKKRLEKLGYAPTERRLNKFLRNSKEYALWRKSIFERDNYTCKWCGKCGGQLEADHILPWATHPEHRFSIDNGRTLCKKCHKRRHRMDKEK